MKSLLKAAALASLPLALVACGSEPEPATDTSVETGEGAMEPMTEGEDAAAGAMPDASTSMPTDGAAPPADAMEGGADAAGAGTAPPPMATPPADAAAPAEREK
jgi:hypothetical protein